MLLYRLLLAAGFPLLLLYLGWRSLRDRSYAGSLAQRLGWIEVRNPGAASLWLHAVSVGEVNAALPLVRRLRALLPGVRMYVTVTTLAGWKLARERLSGSADAVLYAPLDYAMFVRRFLRRLRPGLLIVLETEIWPNLWYETVRSGAALLVVNGRISDRAAGRYHRLRWFFAPILGLPAALLVQTEEYAARYRRAGAPAARLRVGGNLKYDFDPRGAVAAEVKGLLERSRPGAIWIAASTMPPAEAGDPDEDEAVIVAFEEAARAERDLLLVLAPRRPERFGEAASRLERRGIAYVRRSGLTLESKLELPGCLLVDTIGELAALFQVGDVVFMGGTLARRGGHNLLEPAFFGKPVISGPHLENFPEIAADFRRAGALEEIGGPAELAPAVVRLIRDPERRRELGERAAELARLRSGAAQVAAQAAVELHQAAVSGPGPELWRRLAGALPAAAWRGGVAVDRWWKARSRRRLPAPVVSVGGLAMGGVGKTPFTLWLGARLKERGWAVGFLTRGYGRRAGGSVLVAGAGQPVDSERIGDEAQLLIRSGIGPVGIGASRWEAGMALAAGHPVDVFLLDDGFQHWALERDVDVVLIDSLDPWAGGLFPVGRLREDRRALDRAGAVLLTRCERGLRYESLEEVVRERHAALAVYHASTVPAAWVEAATGRRRNLAPTPAPSCGAFCGLGNADAFWSALGRAGVQPAFQVAFRDHHRHTRLELRGLRERAAAAGVGALVTTEKDVANFPPGWQAELCGIDVFWLEVETSIWEEAEFLDWLLARLSRARAGPG